MIFGRSICNKQKNSTAVSAGGIAALAVLLIFILTPSFTSKGAYDGIQLCLNIAVPSLFPMMFAAMLIIETNFAQFLGEKLSGVTNRLFALPGAAGTAVLLAITGGFPAGAKAVCELYNRGVVGKENAQRMLLFCFSAGPAFLLGTVGGLYNDVSVGALLICVQVISIIVIGFLTRFLPKAKEEKSSKSSLHNYNNSKSIGEAMTAAARKTASAMLNICLFIIIFSVIKAIIDNCGASAAVVRFLTSAGIDENKAEAFIPVILEVTSGCVYASDVGIPMTAFAVGFGGLAVHMQIIAISGKLNINYPLFLAARLLQGFLCAALSFAALQIFPSDAASAASFNHTSRIISTTPTGAVMLILMSFMCVMCIPKQEKN